MNLRSIYLCVCISLSVCTSAQKKDDAPKGMITGRIVDTVRNIQLQSATVAVYTYNDTSLLKYQLSDNEGDFRLTGLPVGTTLRIICSYTGYLNTEKVITIPDSVGNISVGVLSLHRIDNVLQTVVVRSEPPVRMNNDTLEFNAAAFKLAPNAQTEDLLRALPGITVWGDGTITFNGKPVASVLVNGKPFFGKDARIATQNLPKNIVDKIQVYQKSPNSRNEIDSLTEVNIKLKKNKGYGHFGKFSGGYGTAGRYETDASLNFFTPKTQIGFVGAHNNINKITDGVEVLVRTSTFKGIGANTEYQPNLSITGHNRFNAAGIIFQHDFIPDADFFKNNRFSANYFIRSNNRQLNKSLQTTTALGRDSNLVQQSRAESYTSNTNQQLSANYIKQKDKIKYTLYTSFIKDLSENRHQDTAQTQSSGGSLKSINNSLYYDHSNSQRFKLGGSLEKSVSGSDFYYQVSYYFKTGWDKNTLQNKTSFLSYTNANERLFFNRLYSNNFNDQEHDALIKLGDLNSLIFGPGKLWGMTIELQNKLNAIRHTENNFVQDKDSSGDSGKLNEYLTNKSHYTATSISPGLSIFKTIYKTLLNRYAKSISLKLTLQQQYVKQKNESTHDFQNFGRDFGLFLPEANIQFINKQLGEYTNSYDFTINKSADYPTADQLVPLIDSINIYYIKAGNRYLQPQQRYDASFIFNHTNEKLENAFSYGIQLKGGVATHFFADSSLTDASGRSIHYPVNRNGYRHIDISANLSKAFKFQRHQIQVILNTSGSFSRNPNYINQILNYSNNALSTVHIDLYYSLGDRFSARAGQLYSYFASTQKYLTGGNFYNSQSATILSASLNLNSKLCVSSNATYYQNASSGSNATNFCIWNASANYRFFKDNRAEIKFSILDILRQNKGIINTGYNNSITYGTVNVLQQYFMVTLSYFPRQFGKP